MAKDQQQNPVTENPKEKEAKAFRKLSEFSVEELLALPRVQMRVTKVVNETYHTERYNCYVYFFNKQLEIRFPIDRSTFYLIGVLRGLDVVEKETYSISFPYRIVKGRGVSEEDGHEFDYYYVEGYACPMQKKVFLSCVLKGSQVDLLTSLKAEGIVDRGFSGKEKESEYFDDLG